MVYRVIGLMSGSSLDGLDIVFTELHENGGKWTYEIIEADCYPYSEDWIRRLKTAISLTAVDYQLLHVDYGHYLGQQVNRFVEEKGLQYKVALVSSHGHTTFHVPSRKMTGQLGDGASIASEIQLPVVTDLRAMDVAFGGQGAPIVPIGEKLLLEGYDYFLNLGGIANVSARPHRRPLPLAIGTKREGPKEDHDVEQYIAFDVCAANRVLNMLANEMGLEYDKGGEIAATGNVDEVLLKELNQLEYYKQRYPKSLANDFGTDIVYPLVKKAGLSVNDALRTYTEHVAVQLKNSIASIGTGSEPTKMLVTGGGALNTFLVECLRQNLKPLNIEVIVPDEKLVNFKEALIMALIGVLRWREEYNVLSSVTGAMRDSIGGALWLGQEA